jgi:hypothetical protein
VQHHAGAGGSGKGGRRVAGIAHFLCRGQGQRRWHHVGHTLLLHALRDPLCRHAAQGRECRVASFVGKGGDRD